MTARKSPTGSIRQSVTILAAVAAAAAIAIYLADGLAAAATGLALVVVGGLALARYAAGTDAQDSGHRKAVRLLGSSTPALGEWRRIVDRTLGQNGEVHFATTLRPQLQRLFAARLAERHGIELYRSPQRARGLIGPELWPWLAPDAPPPEPELPEPVLHALLARLEAL